jgi:enediyne biosynthesis protein E3
MKNQDSATPLDLALEGSGSLRTPRPLRRRIARLLFGIAPGETSFERRGFRWDSEAVRQRLEGVAGRFVEGYHAALEEVSVDSLAVRLGAIPAEVSGFAYEGAGMALALLDVLTPWKRNRLDAFLRGPGAPHNYLVNVGAGWILARLPLSPERLRAGLDPVLGWLALDGYGFHEGFFHPQRTVTRHEVPAKVRGYAQRAFDQGIGRSLWFVEGAGPQRLNSTISAFPGGPGGRQGDIWSGTGLACAYAGGRDRTAVEELLRHAGEHAPQLAQGIAFAAEARRRAGNLAPQTALACDVVWKLGAEQVARLAVEAGENLPTNPTDPAEPAYEVWRRRIQQQFSERMKS